MVSAGVSVLMSLLRAGSLQVVVYLSGREWRGAGDVYVKSYQRLTCGNLTDALFRLCGFCGKEGFEKVEETKQGEEEE